MMMWMMRSRTVVLIGSLSLAAGWMAGSVSVPVEQDLTTSRPTGPRPLGVQLRQSAPLTEQLREKLDDRPKSPSSARNPFTFGARRFESVRRTERRVDPDAPVLENPAPTAPPVPRFKLSGVASTEKDGAVQFTAILTDNGALVFAETGTTIPGGYRVLRVDEQTAVLVDAAGGEIVLRLP